MAKNHRTQLIDTRLAPKQCQECGARFTSTYLPQKFCSNSCAARYHWRDRRALVKAKQCEECGAHFMPTKPYRRQTYCSKSCAARHHWRNPDYRARLSAHVSAQNRRRWCDDDYFLHMLAKLQARCLDLDFREKLSVAVRSAWKKRREAYHLLRLLLPEIADQLFADCKTTMQRYAKAYRLGKQLTPKELAVLLMTFEPPARDKEES